MATPAQRDLLPVSEAVLAISLAQARNTLRYGVFGELETTGETIQRIIEAIPEGVAAALRDHAFIFVPLALGETGMLRETEIARVHRADLAERATCHRTVPLEGMNYTFISTRLMEDRFALAFELYINVGHQYVDSLAEAQAPPPERFTTLVWQQALAEVRGETSQEAYQARKRAIEFSPEAVRGGSAHLAGTVEHRLAQEQRQSFYKTALADTLAIYMLSLAIDLDYADLREREYPLLAAPAMADRLRLAAELFAPPAGYEFSLRYRRRH